MRGTFTDSLLDIGPLPRTAGFRAAVANSHVSAANARRRVRIRAGIWLLLSVMLSGAALADVHVRGYFKKNGAYVAPHYRSAPDGNFYNNWSTRGNVNPYTGIEGSRVTPPPGGGAGIGALGEFYRALPPVAPGARDSSVPTQLPELSGVMDDTEVARSTSYCRRLYTKPSEFDGCVYRQASTLARIALPDYSSLPSDDVSRSTNYCERLYDDDRAGFYNCVNRQVLGLQRPAPATTGVDSDEFRRSQDYCERLYGDDRAGNQRCVESQAQSLRRNAQFATSDLPQTEWERGSRYCDRLYQSDRGGAARCKSNQAEQIRRYRGRAGSPSDVPYCERLYGDDRGGFWRCVN